jgi:PAS domain S-box-containing protein
MSKLAGQLPEFEGDVHDALERVSTPMYVLDRDGTIVWLNAAAKELVPTGVGRRFTEVVMPDQVKSAKRRFAQRMLGKPPFEDHTTAIRDATGSRVEVEISSVPLRSGGQIVGVFGVALPKQRSRSRAVGTPPPELTARQHEVLSLLSEGHTTAGIATQLVLSEETVRNHIKAALRELGARSRLEAVIWWHRLGPLERGKHTDD